MKLCVIGLGYTGLPTAVLFASRGIETLGVELKNDGVQSILEGNATTGDSALDRLARRVVQKKELRISRRLEPATAYIISLDSPDDPAEAVQTAHKKLLIVFEALVKVLNKGNSILIETTLAPGMVEETLVPLLQRAGYCVGKDIFLAYCPERILTGNPLYEFENNNRIIGGVTPACAQECAGVYERAGFRGHIIKTNVRIAETAKLIESVYRDVNIAFANEVVQICDECGVDALEVIRMANLHPHVDIHHPGPGVGGHVLPRDPHFIFARTHHAPLSALAREINEYMPQFVFEKIDALLQGDTQKKIAVLGVSYKGGVADTYRSPALEVVHLLAQKYPNIALSDPLASMPGLVSLQEALRDSSLGVVLTDHEEYKELDYQRIRALMREPVLFDTRACLKPTELVRILHYGNLFEAIPCVAEEQ